MRQGGKKGDGIMKKPKKPGDNISLKTKKNESPNIIEWINCQTNLMDSIRYLIENEVSVNGIRNLQNHIPSERVMPSIPASTSIPAKEALIQASISNKEIAVTKEKPVNRSLSSSARSTSSTPLTDDLIDDDDIESWL